MTRMLREQSVEPLVDYFGLCLQEADDAGVPVRWPEGWEVGQALAVGRPGRLDLESAGHTHQAVMKVEVWDGAPPVVAGEWEVSAVAELFSLSGQLTVWGVTGPAYECVDLGRPDTRWRVRVHCAGRARLAEPASVDVPDGVERWLMQFWPCARVEPAR